MQRNTHFVYAFGHWFKMAGALGVGCDHCGLTAEQAGKSLKACAKCYDVHYCGKECQLAAWPGHKAACKARGKKRADELAARVSLGALPTR